MKARKWLCTTGIGLMLFTFAFVAIVATLPKNFDSSMDTALSSTGLALSRAYYDNGLAPIMKQPGFIYNGTRQVYANWPALGFKTMAAWYRVLGGDSIYQARLLSALLYAVSAVLLFALLLRCNVSMSIATIGTLWFIVLPYHLEFGKLIYADMWLLPFWLACFLINTYKSKYRWLIVPLALVGGLGFMWFVLFVLIALCFIVCSRRFAWSAPNGALFAVGLLLVAYGMQYALISAFPETRLFMGLDQWSVFSLFGHPDVALKQLVQTSLRLFYESFSVVVIICLALSSQGSDVWQNIFSDPKKNDTLSIMLLTLGGLCLLFPSWILTHNTGTAFFSVLIATAGAFVLQAWTKPKFKTKLYLGGGCIAVTLLLFIILPQVNKDSSAVFQKIDQVTAYIDDTDRHQMTQPNIVIKFHRKSNWAESLSMMLGVKEATRSYIFSGRNINSLNEAASHFDANNARLKKHRKDFDSKHVYFLTDKPDVKTVDTGLTILGVFNFQDWYLYSIEL